MRMRDRLFVFSTVQLLLFGALFAMAYVEFAHRVVPTFEQGLRDKTASVARQIGAEIDVALATDDTKLAAEAMAPYVVDPDFAYVTVRNARGQILLVRGGEHPDAFTGPPLSARVHDGEIEAWAPVTIEGVTLGAVAVAFSSARIDELKTWVTWVSFVVVVVWILALVYSVWFARSFVSPIRAMMRFSRRVASGTLTERLDVNANDELGGLQMDLNSMAIDLDRRATEAQRRAEETEHLQEALLVMSRTAGMAEVATNVLHNVGNVLNSLNVSVAVIGDGLRESKVRALARSMEAVARAPGGLAGFLGTEKGKALPDYLRALSARLCEENHDALAELASIVTNVDHIKTVIATQQSYALGSNMTETVPIANLIDDALRMGEVSFSRHGIEVIKNYDDIVSIETDRHKLLEILVNVISNARHALKEAGSQKLELGVSLRLTELGIAIAISDTGVGIPAANLDKVFQHGFTTKRSGHGFGLHACANTAQQLGGTITAASDGPGRGAVFTINLPLRHTKRGAA